MSGYLVHSSHAQQLCHDTLSAWGAASPCLHSICPTWHAGTERDHDLRKHLTLELFAACRQPEHECPPLGIRPEVIVAAGTLRQALLCARQLCRCHLPKPIALQVQLPLLQWSGMGGPDITVID